MDFKKMMNFVKKTLEDNDAIVDKKHNYCFRNRYEHSIRVFKWVKRLSVDFDNFPYKLTYRMKTKTKKPQNGAFLKTM